MRIKNSREILEYCLSLKRVVFGFGHRPDFYKRFEWVENGRLEEYMRRKFNMDVGLVRLGGDVSLHRDKGVKRKSVIICLKDFDFEIGGERTRLRSGDVIEHDGGIPHRGWDCYCIVMWKKMEVNNNEQLKLF